jgi:hypothetical protein
MIRWLHKALATWRIVRKRKFIPVFWLKDAFHEQGNDRILIHSPMHDLDSLFSQVIFFSELLGDENIDFCEPCEKCFFDSPICAASTGFADTVFPACVITLNVKH